MRNTLDEALARRDLKLVFSCRFGFGVVFQAQRFPLSCSCLSKVVSKFIDALISNPYFAREELDEIRMLSRQLEKELLSRRPQTISLVHGIESWFKKSPLRQNQLKEWLKSAPHLFLSEVLREQKLEL